MNRGASASQARRSGKIVGCGAFAALSGVGGVKSCFLVLGVAGSMASAALVGEGNRRTGTTSREGRQRGNAARVIFRARHERQGYCVSGERASPYPIAPTWFSGTIRAPSGV